MNLDIEGTKHEKVVIIVLSYVMGFTAGFICFGIGTNRMHAPTPIVESRAVAEEAQPETPADTVAAVSDVSPVTEIPPADTSVESAIDSEPTAAAAGDVSVAYTDGKLEVHVGAATYLLSMKSTNLNGAAIDAFKNQGVHADIPAYSVSPDGKFVYFCEQPGIEDSCNNLVFDVAKNLISYVTLDGKKLTSTAAVAKATTWAENGLTIDGATSADPLSPAALLHR